MSEIDTFLEKFSPSVQAIVQQARQVVRDTLPDALEWLDVGNNAIRYGRVQKMNSTVAYIAPFKDSANLGFYKGTSLPDPTELLHGTGKNLRHTKFRTLEEVDKPAVRDLIRAAWDEDGR